MRSHSNDIHLNSETVERTRSSNSGWLFSFKEDFLLVLVCLLAGFIFLPVGNIENKLWTMVMVAILYDLHHSYITIMIFSLDKEMFLHHKKTLIPIITGSILAVIVAAIFDHVLTLVSVLSMFHFLRQDLGFYLLSIKNGPHLSESQYKFQRSFGHFFVFGSFLTIVADPNISVVWFQFQYTFISHSLSEALHSILLAGTLFYLWHEFSNQNSSPINYGKLFRVFMILSFWYVLPSTIGSLPSSFLIALHGISYWYLTYQIMKKRWPQKRNLGWRFFTGRYTPAKAFLFTFFITVVGFNVFGGYTLEQSSPLYKALNIDANLNLLMAIAATLFIIHYLADGVIWKKNSPIVRQ